MTPDDTVKNRIYRELRRSIITGHRCSGARLNIKQLASHHGTSVTPVRDALQMLNQEGLVTNKPRSGYFVTPITLKQLCDMLELWKILAVACVERATATITDDQLDVLEHLPRGYIGDDESYDRYIDENRQFYGLIAAATGNQELHNAVGSLHDRLARFIVIRSAGKHTEFTHKRIVEALRTRDVDAARQTMLDELLETRESILNHIISEEGAYWHLR